MKKYSLAEAINYQKKNELSEAKKAYISIIESEPKNFYAIHYLGLLYTQLGEFDAGVSLIKYAIDITGGYPEAENNLLALTKFHEGKYLQETQSISVPLEFPTPPQGTVGMWRTERMIDFVQYFAGLDGLWLTVGDASGGDSLLLKSKGVSEIHASNLDSRILKMGFELGVIETYHEINAERIGFENESFEYVFCKEALHHMPRPYIAIYEMLRVSSAAVFLIEPCDPIIDYQRPLNSSLHRNLFAAYSGHYVEDKVNYLYKLNDEEKATGDRYTDWYEDGSFNYVYTLSEREVRKICFGMGLPAYATKSYNDVYLEHTNNKLISEDPEALKLNSDKLYWQDKFCELSGAPFNMINAILFKKAPGAELVTVLAGAGYKVVITPTVFRPFGLFK